MRLRWFFAVSAFAFPLLAADPQMVGLAIPDSQVIAGVNVEQVMLSPFGQYLLSQNGAVPDAGLPAIFATTGFDPRRDLREILISAKLVPDPDEAILMARGTFDVPKILEAVRAGGATVDTYKGVSFAQMSKNAAIAFPDSTLVISGGPAFVQAAIDRLTSPTSISSALGVQVNQLSSAEDAWFVSILPLSKLNVAPGGATGPGAAALAIYSKVQQASGGIKFGANIVANLQAAMPTDKDATALAGLITSLHSAPDLFIKDVYMVGILQGMTATADGTQVKVSVSVPEQQIEQQLVRPPHSQPTQRPAENGSGAGVPSRIRVGSEVQKAKLVQRVEPVYPPLALQARISGVVRLNAVIGPAGNVENLTVVSGHPLLVQSAMDVVRQWTYQPTLLNGVPVAVVTQIEVPFSLP